MTTYFLHPDEERIITTDGTALADPRIKDNAEQQLRSQGWIGPLNEHQIRGFASAYGLEVS